MQALQAQPQTTAELAAQFNRSDRHIRRTLKDLPVTATRDGRAITYSLKKEEKEAAASSSITAVPGIADISGHPIADISGHPIADMAPSGEEIADISGHDSGHGKPKNSKQRSRIRKREVVGAGHAPKGPHIEQEWGFCQEKTTSLCPLSYAEFERDNIQFVLMDKKFRDLLDAMASQGKWEVRHVRGLMWIRVPGHRINLQVGRDTVTFYSDDPGDMEDIAGWVRETFAGAVDDINSLVSRIKYPQDLSSEELTVVIRHTGTVEAIRSHVQMMSDHGVYTLAAPNENTPGLKIYEPKKPRETGTMRVEFIIHNHIQGISALNMRAALINNLPRIHKIPGLFWEFIQKYYSHMHHPLMIDTGGHDFLQALGKVTDQFTSTLNKLADRIPAALTQEDQKLRELRAAIEALESSELGDIIRTFRDMLNVEEAPTKVFLAAYTIWAKRHFKGRVIKADIASLLLRANDSLPLDEIAAALARLREVRLLQEDERLEIYFSPEGAEIARILMAKREGV